MTDPNIDIVRHAIGIDRDVDLTGEPWRNHYATQDGDPALEDLVRAGLMRHADAITGGLRYYVATDAGIRAARSDEADRRRAAGLRRWLVTTEWDGGSHTQSVLARSRNAAKYRVAANIADISGSLRDALRLIRFCVVAA